MSETNGLVATAINAITGGIAEELVKRVFNSISHTKPAILAKMKIQGTELQDANESYMNFYIKCTILASHSSSLTSEKLQDILTCPQMDDLLEDWILNSYDSLEAKIDSINIGSWDFKIASGSEVKSFLHTLAAQIDDEKRKTFTVAEHITQARLQDMQRLSASTHAIVSELNKAAQLDTSDLDKVQMLIQSGSPKQALALLENFRARTFSKGLPASLVADFYEKKLRCLQRLEPHPEASMIIGLLYQLLENTTDAAHIERIKAIISYNSGNYEHALVCVEKAIKLDSAHPKGYVLRAHCLKALDRAEELTNFLNEITQDLIEKAVWDFARCYFDAGNYQKSETLAHSCLTDEPTHIDALLMLAEIQILNIQEKLTAENSYSVLSRESVQELDRRLALVADVLSQEDHSAVYKYHQLAGESALLTNKYSIAERHFRHAWSISQRDQELLVHLISSVKLSGKREDLLDLANLLDVTITRYWLIQLTIRLEYGEAKAIIADLNGYKAENIPNENDWIRLQEILIHAHRRLNHHREALRIAKELQATHGHIAIVHKFMADILCSHGQYQDAIDCLKCVLPTDTKSSSYLVIAHTLFDILAQTESVEYWELAAQIGDTILSPVRFDQQYVGYLRLLFNLKRYSDCLTLCDRAQEGTVFNADIEDIKASVFFVNEDFELALSIYDNILSREPSNIRSFDFATRCLQRLGKHDEAIERIEAASSDLKHHQSFLLIASKVFAQAYHSDRDIDYAKQAAEYALLSVEADDTSQEPVGHFLRLLMIELPQDAVAQIGDKYTQYCRDLLSNYKSLFPQSHSFEMIELPNDPDAMLSALLERIPDRSSEISTLLTFYKKFHLPLSYLSSLFERDQYRVWRYCIDDPSIPIWIANSSESAQSEEDGIIRVTDRILISIGSIFLLHSLGVLTHLTSTFKEVALTQSGYDLLMASLHASTRPSQEGSKHLSSRFGEFQLIETSHEEYSDPARSLQEITKFVTDHITIVGKSTLDAMLESEWNNTSESLGPEAPILLTYRDISYTLYCDDWFIRNYRNRNNYEPTIYTIPFLRILRDRGSISQLEYSNAIVKMIDWGFQLLPIDEDLLTTLLDNSAFQITSAVGSVFTYMQTIEFDLDNLINFCLGILKWIWRQPATLTSKYLITDSIIAVLASRIGTSSALAIVQNKLPAIISRFDVLNEDRLTKYIEQFVYVQSRSRS